MERHRTARNRKGLQAVTFERIDAPQSFRNELLSAFDGARAGIADCTDLRSQASPNPVFFRGIPVLLLAGLGTIVKVTYAHCKNFCAGCLLQFSERRRLHVGESCSFDSATLKSRLREENPAVCAYVGDDLAKREDVKLRDRCAPMFTFD